jgi:hypothetical protein
MAAEMLLSRVNGRGVAEHCLIESRAAARGSL